MYTHLVSYFDTYAYFLILSSILRMFTRVKQYLFLIYHGYFAYYSTEGNREILKYKWSKDPEHR